MTEPTPTPQAPAAAQPAEPTTPAAPAAPAVAATPGDPADTFKSEESKNAVLADLKKEREARQALEAKIDAQNKAMLAAFGVTEAPKGEELAETVKSLQAQIATDRRAALIDRLAAANGIDEAHQALLTETDPEKLKAQAEMVGALVKANTADAAPPAFQPNPGQGQGGAPGTPEAIAEAEYRQYHPLPSRK